MMDIIIGDDIHAAAPSLRVLVIEARISNSPTTEAVKTLLMQTAESIKERYALNEINLRSGIAATRAAYKACGKEPNRYRPSQEQLCRRIVSGKELYYVSNVVDVINIISILSGYSIGGFDADSIDGPALTLGIGRAGEPYEGIGRGSLNIEGMPVYRDATGGVGTPTSDNERTKTSLSTTRLLMCVNMYGEEMEAAEVTELSRKLLEDHCGAMEFSARVVSRLKTSKD